MRFILSIVLSLQIFVVYSQNKPIFLGSNTIKEGDDFYPTEVVKWKYKGYCFTEFTTMTARPFPFYCIEKNGKKVKNSELFNKNMEEWINRKILTQYSKDKENYPKCYPEVICGVPPIDINTVDVYIDEKNMYFMMLWSNNYYDMLNDKTECNIIYSTTIVEVPIKEIGPYIK